MRKVISILAIAMLVAFTACEKDEVAVEAHSEISVMGNAEGVLQADAYEFPEGIEFLGLGGVDPNAPESVAAEGDLKSAQSYRCYVVVVVSG